MKLHSAKRSRSDARDDDGDQEAAHWIIKEVLDTETNVSRIVSELTAHLSDVVSVTRFRVKAEGFIIYPESHDYSDDGKETISESHSSVSETKEPQRRIKLDVEYTAKMTSLHKDKNDPQQTVEKKSEGYCWATATSWGTFNLVDMDIEREDEDD